MQLGVDLNGSKAKTNELRRKAGCSGRMSRAEEHRSDETTRRLDAADAEQCGPGEPSVGPQLKSNYGDILGSRSGVAVDGGVEIIRCPTAVTWR